MQSKLRAEHLRYILFASLVLLLVGGVALFSFSYSLLKDYTKETSLLNAQADVSDTNVTNLKKLQTYLDENADEVAKAKSIVAESQQYQYQDDIIRDISNYAAETGITITSFTFVSNTGAGATPAPAPAATPGPTGGQTVPASPAGLKTTTADIAITSPANYENLLGFIQRIEDSPMKMQIGSVSLSRVEGDDKSQIATQSFTIEVYIR